MLKLHSLLRKHRITYRALARSLSVSEATLNQIAKYNQWPRSINTPALRTEITGALSNLGWTDTEIIDAWSITPCAAPNPNPDANQQDEFLEPEMLHQNTLEHFKLKTNPFVNDVRGPQDLFLGKDQRSARQSMQSAAEDGLMTAIIGESGSGKSTLRDDLVAAIKRDDKPIKIINMELPDKGRMTAAHICDAIVLDISSEKPKSSLEAKARHVIRLLSESSRQGKQHVLMVEEAQDLEIQSIKFMKRFWEMKDGYQRLLGIILVGQPELERKLTSYNAREVAQRCPIVRLNPLDMRLKDYLELKFKRVGTALADVMTDDAIDAIRARLQRREPGKSDPVSNVYPLAVHNLLSRAMNKAPEIGQAKVTGELIRTVAI